jgi:RNase P subunit RPR2
MSISHHRTITAMESTDLVERRSKFLREAAYLLAVSSPTTSAFLGSAQDRLIEDAELELQQKELDALRRGFCGACGNPMIAGWSCKVTHQTQTQRVRKEKKPAKESRQPTKNVVYTCLRCERQTVQPLQARPTRHVRKSTTQKAPKPTLETRKPAEEADSKVAKSVNASSKQRKKARKGGLQAMLEKTKSQSSSQGGFDLLDFGM